MLDILKKTVLAGIGATVTTKERVESVLEDLVEKGKISTQEARDMAEKIAAEGKSEFEQARREASDAFSDMIRKANFATQNDLKALEARIEKLEAEIAGK